MTTFTSSTTIAASPGTVWGILTDGAAYAEWNPEIVAVDGYIAYGARITAHVRLRNGVVRRVKQRVTRFNPPARMEWTGGLPLGLFTGHRTYTVDRTERGTEFRLHLEMRGLLSPLILLSVGDRQSEIDRFAAALKQRAEQA